MSFNPRTNLPRIDSPASGSSSRCALRIWSGAIRPWAPSTRCGWQASAVSRKASLNRGFLAAQVSRSL